MLLTDPQQEEDLKEALRAEGVFNDNEDPELSIANSLNVIADKINMEDDDTVNTEQ